MRGKLVVFEGIEGAGKTNQILKAASALRAEGRPVLCTKEPGGTAVGGEIRTLLLDEHGPITPTTELLLFAADRAQHVEKVLKPHLSQGHIILCDRFTASTVAYQGYGRGLDLSLINELNAIATGGLQPDLTIWLDVDVAIALSRVSGRQQVDRIESEATQFHQRVREGFQAIYDADQKMERKMVCIDANEDIDSVASRVASVVKQKLVEWG